MESGFGSDGDTPGVMGRSDGMVVAPCEGWGEINY